MGKISDALKKVQEQREKDKITIRQEIITASTKTEDTPSSKPDAEKPGPKGLTLEEKLRLKEKLFLARSTDNSGIDPRVVAYFSHSSPVSEQYRILRTNIKSSLKKLSIPNKGALTRNITNSNMFTISSALHNEGKTVTAVNLAMALASDLESKVLLVDCDLRNGALHKLLNVNFAPGLSDILSGDFDWPVALHPTVRKNLFVIPRGKSPANPSELLGSKKMRSVLQKLKTESFTHVILDTPPLIPFTDARVLGLQTEGVIIVVQAQRTKAHIVEKAKELLEQAHNKFLGFILTKTDHRTPDFCGYYYYYHQKNS